MEDFCEIPTKWLLMFVIQIFNTYIGRGYCRCNLNLGYLHVNEHPFLPGPLLTTACQGCKLERLMLLVYERVSLAFGGLYCLCSKQSGTAGGYVSKC